MGLAFWGSLALVCIVIVLIGIFWPYRKEKWLGIDSLKPGESGYIGEGSLFNFEPVKEGVEEVMLVDRSALPMRMRTEESPHLLVRLNSGEYRIHLWKDTAHDQCCYGCRLVSLT